MRNLQAALRQAVISPLLTSQPGMRRLLQAVERGSI